MMRNTFLWENTWLTIPHWQWSISLLLIETQHWHYGWVLFLFKMIYLSSHGSARSYHCSMFLWRIRSGTGDLLPSVQYIWLYNRKVNGSLKGNDWQYCFYCHTKWRNGCDVEIKESKHRNILRCFAKSGILTSELHFQHLRKHPSSLSHSRTSSFWNISIETENGNLVWHEIGFRNMGLY